MLRVAIAITAAVGWAAGVTALEHDPPASWRKRVSLHAHVSGAI